MHLCCPAKHIRRCREAACSATNGKNCRGEGVHAG
jgi:hypothetical protein